MQYAKRIDLVSCPCDHGLRDSIVVKSILFALVRSPLIEVSERLIYCGLTSGVRSQLTIKLALIATRYFILKRDWIERVR